MRTVNIHDAKTHFSQLIAATADGETVVIAKAGRPVAKLSPLDTPLRTRRIGFLPDLGLVPDDFDRLGEEDILAAFEGDE